VRSPATFTVKKKNLDRLIGKEIPAGEVYAILERLDIQVSDKKPDSFLVSVPTYRVEVKLEADIVEEVLRIYGFNNIPLAPHAGSTFISGFPAKDPGKAYYERHKLATGLELVPILNKLSEELGVMRATMLFSGLEVCAFNINRKQRNLKLFEFGKIYGRKGQGYHESERLAIFLSGQAESDTWQRPARAITYSDLSQAVADILDKSAIRSHQLSPLDDPMFEYGMCIVSGKLEIGRMGKVKQSFQKDFGLKQEIFYADIDAALLFNAASPKFDVQEVPRFPEVRRDLSIVLDKQVTYREIEELVRNTEKRLIKDIIVFDVYEGDKIQQGKKAYALGFTLLDESKTLTDEEIDRTMNKLIGAFEDKMKAVIRK
jgi:phenylalanyl-tRNA synthetase beta chain